MSKLTGKVAVITGASKGIGAEIARRFAAEGAAVVVNYASSREGADKVVADIVGAGGKAVAVQGNVATAADVNRIFAKAKSDFGIVDILVNNAGVYRFNSDRGGHRGRISPAVRHERARPPARHQGGRCPVRARRRQRDQHQLGGQPPGVRRVHSVYAATKAAVDAITRVLAKELGSRKIRINAINPGGIETEGTHTAGIIGSDFEAQMVQQTPLGRIGQPSDIAPVAVFLASDDARWVTGEPWPSPAACRRLRKA